MDKYQYPLERIISIGESFFEESGYIDDLDGYSLKILASFSLFKITSNNGYPRAKHATISPKAI